MEAFLVGVIVGIVIGLIISKVRISRRGRIYFR